MGNVKHALMTFGLAQVSSWIASAVDFALTIILAKFCGLWYAYATTIGALSGGVVNCIVNYRWVFHSSGMNKTYLALRYFMVWTVSIILNSYGTYALTEVTGMDFIIVKVAVSVAVAVLWNYQMQRIFVYKKR